MSLHSPLHDETAISHGAFSQAGSYQNPVLRESSNREGQMQDRRRIARNDRRDSSRNVRAYSITQGELLELTRAAMWDHAGPGPGAAKKIACDVECSEKTAQNWLDGKTVPSGILDLRAMHAIPSYAALKREIAALETTLDPRLQAKYQELHRLTLELANGGA